MRQQYDTVATVATSLTPPGKWREPWGAIRNGGQVWAAHPGRFLPARIRLPSAGRLPTISNREAWPTGQASALLVARPSSVPGTVG